FEREIEIMATIRHPNVVTFIGACHTPPNVCLVTEFCARGSLDHLLHKSGLSLDLVKRVEFIIDIARGMSCLHSQRPPIVHRDLKPANLLVSARFEVKVADFGLSRIKDHAQLISSRAGLEGTIEYCAPEVLRGEPFTEKCDIWSFGVVTWEVLMRVRPFADADCPNFVLLLSLGNGSLQLPGLKEEAGITPGLVRLVERCRAWEPAERPSFRDVLHCLEQEYRVLRGRAAGVWGGEPGMGGGRGGSSSRRRQVCGGGGPGGGQVAGRAGQLGLVALTLVAVSLGQCHA
ncbi:kinase-like domain-containing protein, partial [Haematococcus lacustris]